ncbi:MAG: hypothetical protein Q7T18_09175 [Sedimentisphaerales bacterium]|nr:hypothetical protein [Sedimentisphaerales bacterium]
MMREFLRKIGVLVVLGIGMGQGNVAMVKAADTPSLKPPLAAREITTKEFANYPPLFTSQAKTLDPVEIVRCARKGYLTNMCEPWGMTQGLKPTLRFYFDDCILPWPQLKHHAVDGFDNNNRNLGAHALLHEMLGKEKDNDAIEEGQIAYLLSITDPDSGLPYNPEALPRQCALGHGELAKNVMLLYEQTGRQWLRTWAQRMLTTLRRYAFVRNLEGVGPIAEYHQGGNGGQGGFVVGEPPVAQTNDLALDGWQHLYVGWNCWAFAQWHAMTGDREALDFAVALANRLCHSSDPNGNDGALRPDGSFGGTTGGSLHMHGHTHCLPGMVLLGKQLMQTGQKDKAVEFILQTDRTFEWLYDASRNPDAGSMTGWLPEFLCVKSGWDRKGDCEGCTMGDMVQTAVSLGDVSRLDPRLARQVDYYDRAEQIFRGQVVESIFSPTPQYLTVLKKCLQKRVEKDLPQATPDEKTRELDKRYQQAVATAQRMDGRLLGLCGFPDWVNHLPSDLDPNLPNINMMGCCADAVIRASHAIWSHTVTGDANETRINLAFNRTSPQVDVISSLPHRGEVNIIVKNAKKVLVRVPGWAPKEKTLAFVNKKPIAAVQWQGTYVVFDKVKPADQLTVTYPIRIAQVKETIYGDKHVEYTEKWRGNTIVDISPAGKWIPMFQRPQLESEQIP